MANETILGNVLLFMQKMGVYDVILPFILVFTIVFAILERTKIFGTETIGGVKYSKKSLNAMTAFVIAFMTIASSKLVAAITRISSQMVVLLLLIVFFLLLIGSFFKEGEVEIKGGWRWTFMVLAFIGLAAIFLDAVKTASGMSWLDHFIDWIASFWTSTAVASIILIIGIIVFVYFMTKKEGESTPAKKEVN